MDLNNIHIDSLIKVIRKHPVLYDTSNKEYYDRIKKRKKWEEVCTILNSSWESSGEKERTLYYKEVQKKWQSLRDCFRRELVILKNQTSSTGKKKAKYKYYDQLEFLIPFTQNMTNEATSSQEDSRDIDAAANSNEPLADANDTVKKRKLSTTFMEEAPTKDFNHMDDGFNRRYMDDDEAFLLSLLPSFKEYSLNQKYLLRIELMKTILRFKRTQKDVGIVKDEVDDEEEYMY